MAGSLLPRVKTWVDDEDVSYSDLNAEFDNTLLAMQPLYIDDYSATVTQMQTTTDPGEVGTESQATTLAGEIARIRHMLIEITGQDEWYESPSSSLAGLANAIGTGLTNNRLVSGRIRTTSDQPQFLVPNGAARTIKLDGTPTSFIYYIDGVEYTISTDVTLTNLTLAPSTNNTCLINDTLAADQDWTKYMGEDGSEIIVDNMNTEITALQGKYAAFKIGGTTDEYCLAYVASSTSLTKIKRGYFFDSADAPIPRAGYSNNDTITLMKLTWIFATTAGALTATYNPPTWSMDEPSSPSIGDYWFDIDNNTWKKYDVSSFIAANAVLVGVCLQDTANTVAARSFEFFLGYSTANTCEVVYESATQVKSLMPGSQLSVWGTTIKNDYGNYVWDITLDRDTGVSETSSTVYYLYITEDGDEVISDIRPYDRKEDLQGYYHPFNSWRCVGSVFNGSGSDFGANTVISFSTKQMTEKILHSQTALSRIDVLPQIIPLSTSGGAFTKYLQPAALWRGQTLRFWKTSSDITAATIQAFGAETIIEGIASATTTTVDTPGEVVDLTSDGISIYAWRRYIPTYTASFVHTVTGLGTVTAATGSYTRTGKWLESWGFHTNGTVSAALASATLPGALAIDTTIFPKANTTSNQGHICGEFANQAAGNAGHMVTATGTSAVLVYWAAINDNAGNAVPQLGNAIATSSSVMAFQFRVPILSWKG